MNSFGKADALRRYMLLLGAVLASLALALAVAQSLAAQELVEPTAPLDVDLSGSTKSVDAVEGQPGDILDYTIILSNSGTSVAPEVNLTDALPAALSYVPGSITVAGGGLYGVSDDVVTWEGAVNVGSPITLQFQAQVSETAPLDVVITNTAMITGSGGPLTLTSATLIAEPSTTLIYMPASYRPQLWQPTVYPVTALVDEDTWIVEWGPFDYGVSYELDESLDPSFSTYTRFETGNVPYMVIDRPGWFNNRYYYRVRARTDSLLSDWSPTVMATVPYYDGFDDGSSGWSIRREDTDDVNNSSYYQNGYFVLKIGGRWDYGIAAPMREAPEGSYRIEMDMRLDEPKNLNTGGIVWAGDYLGGDCPNQVYDSCFNHYYRLIILWYGAPETMRIQVKRIDKHEEPGNAGRGETLIDWSDIHVGTPEASHKWAVEYTTDGDIAIFVDGSQVATANDSTYINDRYFGIWASTDEYLGAEPTLDYLKVVPIAP